MQARSMLSFTGDTMEPVINIQFGDNTVSVSLCDDCSTCGNTACYDIEKLRKHCFVLIGANVKD